MLFLAALANLDNRTYNSGVAWWKRRQDLQRLFSTFPAGWPGLGLLLLRIAVGGAALIGPGAYFANRDHLTVISYAILLVAIVSGILLIIGFLTPVAAGLVSVGAVGLAFSWFPSPVRDGIDPTMPTTFVAIVAAAILFVGPGAVSIDARLFGRREIIIPAPSRPIKL